MTDPAYPWLGGVPLQWASFLDTPPSEDDPSAAAVFVIPVPYDATTSHRPGARHGPAAIISASRHLEDYDIELQRDISAVGIHTTPALRPNIAGPKAMIADVRAAVLSAAGQGKIAAILGGDHSISVGAAQAFASLHPDLSVLYIDAHADLRDRYMGSRWGHASAARRIQEICPIVQIGVRSISEPELRFARQAKTPIHFWRDDAPSDSADSDIAQAADFALANLSPNVYISFDLDALDPSIMSAVGTPEPGGILWRQALFLLRAVAARRRIVGFDIVELAPDEGPAACALTAAKLAYKLIGYATPAPA